MCSTILKWTADFLFGLAGLIIAWALRAMLRLTWFLLRQVVGHPRTTISLGLLGAAVLTVGWETLVGLVGILVIAGSTWKALHCESWERFAVAFLRTWTRKWWTYRRVWSEVMNRCGLVIETDNERRVPQVKKFRSTPYWDRLVVRLEVGQEVEDFRAASERIRHAFRAQRIAVHEVEPADVGLDFMRRDPFLSEKIAATPIPASAADIDFTAIPVGLTEFLEPFTVSITGGHLSVAGTSGAGKAGAEWNILRGIAPGIAAGTVKPVFIDPKGVELRQGRDLVDAEDYATTDQDTLDLLQRLVDEMETVKAARGEQGERDHVPSVEYPLRPVFIDEFAPLLAYWKRSIRDKIEDALGIILTQGRAFGYIVIGEIQEPTKDVFRLRDLFGRRLGLRLPTEDHTDAALTDKASSRGALCHEIPESLPGVLFSLRSGDKRAVRARLGYVRDDDIAELVDYVTGRRSNVTPIDRGRKLPAA